MRQHLLGLFIIFQLMFLPTANVVKLLPLRLPESRGELDDDIQRRGTFLPEPLQSGVETLATACNRWGEISGQAQGWSLFAPTFGHQASLPGLSFEPQLGKRQCRFEPEDLNQQRIWPWPSCRQYGYEFRMSLLYWTWSAESFAAQPEAWRKAAIARVRRQQRSMATYMKWSERNAGLAQQADETMLAARHIADGRLQREIPIARWRKGESRLQAWDPVDQVWVDLPVEKLP